MMENPIKKILPPSQILRSLTLAPQNAKRKGVKEKR